MIFIYVTKLCSSFLTIILCNEANFYLPADAVDDDLQKISGHLQGAE